MRRKEFDLYSEKEYNFLMENQLIGQLGVIDDNNYPRIVPLNFAVSNDNQFGEAVYCHGAKEGEKFKLFKNNPKVTFSVYKEYSYIPSYFMSKIACSATQFFKSVHIRGTGNLIDEVDEKVYAIKCLMKKHEPEVTFIPIEYENLKYKGFFDETALFKITIEEKTMKIKFGQNNSEAIMTKIIQFLEERGQKIDKETIIQIKKWHPVLKNNNLDISLKEKLIE